MSNSPHKYSFEAKYNYLHTDSINLAPLVLSKGKKLNPQEHTTFCSFLLSLNNPLADRGNGHWNFHTGLADYVFERFFAFPVSAIVPVCNP